MKQQIWKRGVSLLLAMCLLLGLMPQITFEASAASNLENGFQGQDADAFTALGFDTTEIPVGYDPDTTENPYGRDTILGNQVFEALITTNAGNRIYGTDDNSVAPSSINTRPGSNAGGLDMDMFASAAGDFDGDGLPGEVVYVGYQDIQYNTVETKATLQLQIYDGTGNEYGTKKDIGSVNPAQVITSGGTTYSRYDYAWQNLLQVTAGDFDCDGTAEIAVYVPDNGNARVDIYKYQKTSQSGAADYLDMANWGRVWTHVISNTANQIPNMVSVTSGDFNRDGVDDLAVSSGRMSPSGTDLLSIQVDRTSAVILWGAKSNMLQSSSPLDLNEDELGELTRVSLTTGDLDGDGYRELIATGQPIDDLKNGSYTGNLAGLLAEGVGIAKLGNTTRSITTYIYDGEDGLAINYTGLHKPVDGEMTQDGSTIAWQSGNGFDQYYYSQPLVRTNAAAFHPEGADYPYLYLDSCLYEFVEGQPQLSGSLDDNSYDGENTLGGDGAWGPAYTGQSHADYLEFGAAAEDINGDGYDTLITSYYRHDSRNDGTGKHFSGFNTLYGGENGILNTQRAGDAVTGQTNYYGTLTPVSVTMVDVDMDTILIEYTGEHYLKYSDPKVLAVIAAAPYYQDVEVVSGYDYAWQNITSYSESESHTDTKIITVDLETGAFYSFEKSVAGSKFALETSINFTMEYEEQESDTTEYTLQFETSGDEDAVAFFSIPTENYVYKFSVPNGEGGYDVHYDTISNTFAPCYQVLNLSYYESIQESYDELPAIANEVLKSTPGDPSSYPSSTSGYDVLAYWGADQGEDLDGNAKGSNDPAAISFGNGAITQEITISEEKSKSYNMGAALDFKIGGGIGTQSDVTQSETSKVGGFQFSLNPAGGWADVDVSGFTYSGTVTNMPLQFRDYGYFFAWELFVYSFEIDKDNKIPVVSYVVTDVSAPPELPEDFQQDYDRTTSDKNVLTWTYDDAFSKFYIYKYFDFPVGGGLQMVKEIPASTADYTLKYDENGKPYKEYYFEDTNLAPYTEYEYAIQVERLSKVPPLSTPSALLSARTKAAKGYPNMSILESDGENDAMLLVYPDKTSYLTVDVTGPDGQAPEECYTTVQYQWQKLENGAWTDLVNETNKTLTLASADVTVKGDYRCRVNVLTNIDATAITAYTNTASLSHAKRTSYVEELYVNDVSGGGVELYAKIANGHSDSGSIPGGMVIFNLTNNQTGMTYQRYVELNAAGIASEILEDSLPEGMYTIEARYTGTKVFKSCASETLYLSQRGSGFDLDVPSSIVYGEGTTAIFRAVTKTGGVTSAVEASAVTKQLLKGDPLDRKLTYGAQTLTGLANVTVIAGKTYRITTDGVTYDFAASWDYTGDLTIVGNYITYGSAVTEDYLHDPNEVGVYEIAPDTPAGGYVLIMAGDDNVDVYAGFTVERREITLQLPHQKGEEGSSARDEPTDAPSVPVGQLSLISGSWADCDLDSEGILISSIGNTGLWLDYLNTAGTVFSRWSVDALCGYYTIVAQEANGTRPALANYDITYIPGSYTVLGATREVHIGARPFETQQVGTVYALSPEYGSTRVDISSGDKLVQEHATGTRLVFSAVPDEGYEVYDWYINGIAQGSKATSLAYVLLAEDTTVEVQFAIKQNTLIFGTAGDAGGGTIECSDADLTSESAVLANSHFFFTAKANPGYHFKEWRYTEIGNGTAYDETDNGQMESTFELLMPSISCSVYAVFERDYYTFSYSDRSGQNGLTAWYEGSATTDSTAAAQRIYIESGESVKGDTTITVAPKNGYTLHPDYAYISEGSQGAADYDGTGAYTLKLTEDTHVTGTAQQEFYDLTLNFDVTTTAVFPEGTELVYTIGGEQYSFAYSEETPYTVIENVPGGSNVSVQISYPGYYDLLGFTSAETQVTATETPNKLAVEVTENGTVTAGNAYYFEDYSDQGESRTWYFVAPVDGTVEWNTNAVTVYTAGDTYTISALSGSDTIHVHLNEKPVYQVTMADITGKGTYGLELSAGASQAAGVEGSTVVTLHRDDTLTVLVTPEQKWTVSYWKTQSDGMAEPVTVRATSLKYAIPDISENFTFTPIFSSTTYNTISWPSIDESKNGLTLSPASGYLSSVSAGSDFVFTLSGKTEYLVNQVYANGEPFVSSGDGNLLYTGSGEDRIYTIKDIQENQVITVSMISMGITVDGVDINAMSGPGWRYDPNTQVLHITRSGLLVSGTSTTWAPDLTMELSAEVTTMEIQDLNLKQLADTNADRTAITAKAESVTITAVGENSIQGQISANNLVLRGDGSLNVQNVSSASLAAKSLTLLGRVDVTAENGNDNYAVNVDVLYMGAEDSTSANPTLQSGDGIHASTVMMYRGLLKASRAGTPLSTEEIRHYDGEIALQAEANTPPLVPINVSWTMYSETGYLVQYRDFDTSDTVQMFSEPVPSTEFTGSDRIDQRTNFTTWNSGYYFAVKPLGDTAGDGIGIKFKYTTDAKTYGTYPIDEIPTDVTYYYGVRSDLGTYVYGGLSNITILPGGVGNFLGLAIYEPSEKLFTLAPYTLSSDGTLTFITEGAAEYTLSGYAEGVTVDATKGPSTLILDGITYTESQLKVNSDDPVKLKGDNAIINVGYWESERIDALVVAASQLSTNTSYRKLVISSDDGQGNLQLTSLGYAINAGNGYLDIELRNIKELIVDGAFNARSPIGVTYKNLDGSEADNVHGVQDRVVYYDHTWRVDAGDTPADAVFRGGSSTNSVNVYSTDAYVRAYTITREALISRGVWVNEEYCSYAQFIRPVGSGVLRPLAVYLGKDGDDNEIPCVSAELINSEGEKVDDLIIQLINGNAPPDSSRTDIHGFLSVISYRSWMDLTAASMMQYPVGDYFVRIHLVDEDPTDATYYYFDVPLTIERTGISKHLSITPEAAVLGRDRDVTFTATASGTTPSSYKWFVNDEELYGETGSTMTYTVPADAEIGRELTITVRSYEGETELAVSNAVIRVTPSVAASSITAKELSASDDGSFHINHTEEESPGAWDFDAVITLDDGTTSEEVSFSLWGNVLRATSIDPATGVLTISPKETGTNGLLEILIDYTNADGSSYRSSVVIRLIADSQVALEQADGGTLTMNVEAGTIASGTEVVVTAVPDEDYILEAWYVNGESIADNAAYTVDTANNTLTFTTDMLGSYTITASFLGNMVPVTWEDENITISVDGTAVSNGGYIPYGAVFTVSVDVPAEYRLEDILVTGAVLNEDGSYTAGEDSIFIEPVFVPLNHEHSYESVVTAPTCTDMGYTTHTCTDTACGYSYVDSYVSALGHSCEETVTEPTCKEIGYTMYTCACGYSYQGNIENPTGHSYVETITEPTHNALGYTTYTCEVEGCGYSYTDSYVDAIGHTYTETVTAPTCTTDGFTTYSCDCGHSHIGSIVPSNGHIYSSEVTAPTHDTMGYTTHICTVADCGHSYIDTYVDALEHSYTQTVTKQPTCNEDGELTFTCECGASYTQIVPTVEDGHDYAAVFIEATCEAEGYTTYTCGDCGHSYISDYTEALGHTCTETVTSPTCQSSGHTLLTCENCNYSSITNITKPLPHTEVIRGAVEPSYLNDGYTGDTVCQECGTVLEVGSAMPHLVAESADFTDVSQDAWYSDAVNYVIETGLMNGVGNGEFAPELETSRAMMVTLLYRLEGEPDVSGLTNPFTDVAEDSWYYNAVIWGANTGVVKGISATEFAPDQIVTREQMATMLYRYAGEPDVDGDILNEYPDKVDISSFATDAMAWMVQEGIINGISKNGQIKLAPKDSSTRAQIAAVFMRYVEK